ncbi:hypothetical protein MPTK1_6g01900 [Marchantia polymorpha subsp. ruderalis]|uniref:Uncharacterized protein n=2 Tax=Marchantia polymorpha TaxID=3197 RepID=A0AAF6BMK1_MARPO|nr:hypothetical protein MARPO_0052s0014 [Marchantia polymorpha]BBN13235.1 hypothetical protein Mp_6g01900 [Marchantia polymorpha subsp. ruderalis]|eukprot:PTQ38210.1 hypothetical protein MARPO_0052s0014 [Marchantia polymorpha]
MALDGAIRGVLEARVRSTAESCSSSSASSSWREGFASSSSGGGGGLRGRHCNGAICCRVAERRKQFFGSALRCGEDGKGGGGSARAGRARRWHFGEVVVDGGAFFKVRAEAEVADGSSARSETGIGASGSVRQGRDDDGDSGKAQALSDSAIYPVMRVFRNDLCSLEITGDAKALEVVSAMAADGGFTASEELSKGRSLMTVETIVPGRPEDHSTVSTKLLAPTRLVNKRAKLMWAKGVAQKKVSLSSGNALARAFQSVVVQRVLAFDLRVQVPGTVRDMANLANEKETGLVASLESRDGKVLDGLAEAVCSYVLANIKDTSERKSSGKGGFWRVLPFWDRPQRVWSLDKTICLSTLSDSEVVQHAKQILSTPTARSYLPSGRLTRTHHAWWPLSDVAPASSFLTSDGVHCFAEHIPIHRIEIDISKVRVETKHWNQTRDNIVELQLTHAQLVDIADMLDLFYEDGFTAPSKRLRSGTDLKVSQNIRSKVGKAIWTAVGSVITGGILIVGLFVASKMRVTPNGGIFASDLPFPVGVSVAETLRSKWCTPKYNQKALLPSNDDIPREELAALCAQLIVRMKDAFGLDGEIKTSPEKGAWLGPDITDWGKKRSPVQVDQRRPDSSSEARDAVVNESSNLPRSEALEEVVLCYQVVVQRDGKVLGFQPLNKPAIRYWANYPFAEDIHNGRRLGPGVVEPGLRYVEPPSQLIAIELLCRPHSYTPSIAARPIELTLDQELD